MNKIPMDKLYVMLHLYEQGLDDAEIQRFEEDEVAVISMLVHAVLQKMRQLSDTASRSPDALHKWLREEWAVVTGMDVLKMEALLFRKEKEPE